MTNEEIKTVPNRYLVSDVSVLLLLPLLSERSWQVGLLRLLRLSTGFLQAYGMGRIGFSL